MGESCDFAVMVQTEIADKDYIGGNEKVPNSEAKLGREGWEEGEAGEG